MNNLYRGKVNQIEMTIQSNTNPNKEYNVVWKGDYNVECDCPGTQYRKKCKHQEFIQAIADEINNKLK